jgi:hypothetical protein
MSKGAYNDVVAVQRVLAQYGNVLPHRNDEMSKAVDTITTRLMRKVDAVMRRDHLERHIALRKVRIEEPDLYEAFQLI